MGIYSLRVWRGGGDTEKESWPITSGSVSPLSQATWKTPFPSMCSSDPVAPGLRASGAPSPSVLTLIRLPNGAPVETRAAVSVGSGLCLDELLPQKIQPFLLDAHGFITSF